MNSANRCQGNAGKPRMVNAVVQDAGSTTHRWTNERLLKLPLPGLLRRDSDGSSDELAQHLFHPEANLFPLCVRAGWNFILAIRPYPQLTQ